MHLLNTIFSPGLFFIIGFKEALITRAWSMDGNLGNSERTKYPFQDIRGLGDNSKNLFTVLP